MFKDFKENLGIFLLVAFFLFIKIFFLLKPHLIGWDEAVYLGMGKYLWSVGQVGIWENIRPMDLPLLLGLFWKLNLNYFFWAELLINLFAAGNLILVYFIGKKIYNSSLGLGAALLLAITPIFFSQSSLIMTHIPAAFFALIAIYSYLLKKSFVWVGLFSSLAFSFRFTQGLLMLAFLSIILFNGKEKLKKISLYALGFLIMFLPFLVFNSFMYMDQTSNFFDAALQPVILGGDHINNPFNPGDWLFYGENLLQQNYLLIFVLFGSVFLVKDFKKNKNWWLIILIGGLYLIYFSYIPNKQLRFSLDFLPYFILLATFGFLEFYKLTKSIKIWRSVIFFVLIFFLFFSFKLMIEEDYREYQWRSAEEHFLVKIYDLPPNFVGKILTTNPIFAAYNNPLFLPFYDDPLTALKVYRAEKSKVNYIIYFEQFYPKVDEESSEYKKALFNLIKKENKLVYQESFADQDFYFFQTI